VVVPTERTATVEAPIVPHKIRVGRPATFSALGQRGRVRFTGGEPRKLRKKQRRSRSPLLYPAVSVDDGRACWVRLAPSEAHLSTPNATLECVVLVEAGTPGVPRRSGGGEVVVGPAASAVLSPKLIKAADAAGAARAALNSTAPLPPGARMLSELRVGDRVTATVLRRVARSAALVSVDGVYRAGPGGTHQRVRAALRVREDSDAVRARSAVGVVRGNPPRGGGSATDGAVAVVPEKKNGTPVVGATFDAYVRFAEPNSGRLTLTLEPVSAHEARRERTRQRLQRQIRRGTLRVNATRVATVVDCDDETGQCRVDAGGLAGQIPQSYTQGEEGVPATKAMRGLTTGDRVWVRIRDLGLGHPDGIAQLERLEGPPSGEDERGGSSSSTAAVEASVDTPPPSAE